jgi:hypothetical protein
VLNVNEIGEANTLVDSDEERERIKLYKINRRKRYLAFAQAQGLGWTSKYHSNGSPLSEDSGIETREQEARLSLCDTHSSPVGQMLNIFFDD